MESESRSRGRCLRSLGRFVAELESLLEESLVCGVDLVSRVCQGDGIGDEEGF